MDGDFLNILTVIVVVILVFGIVIRLKSRNLILFRKKPGRKITPIEKRVLQKKVKYYKKLNSDFQSVFESRVLNFIESKEFIARGDLPITAEMKVLIGAAAVQLCFGLPSIALESFNKILVYPGDYYSTVRKQYHSGEVNPGLGVIVLSWQGFQQGISDPDDGMNLGLHEMAHALQLENRIYNDEYEFLDPEMVERWDHMVKTEISAFRKGKAPLLREYGYTNPSEFFAVSVELFFEKPAYLKAQNLQLFTTLMHLLNQDILKIYKL